MTTPPTCQREKREPRRRFHIARVGLVAVAHVADAAQLAEVAEPEAEGVGIELDDVRDLVTHERGVRVVLHEDQRAEGDAAEIAQPPRPTLHDAARCVLPRGFAKEPLFGDGEQTHAGTPRNGNASKMSEARVGR